MPTAQEDEQQAEQAADADELEIELHGVPEPATESDADVLEISLEEQPDEAAGDELPAVSGLDALVADGTGNWVDIAAICSRTGAGFVVRFRETEPGRYVYVGAERRPGQPGKSAIAGGTRDIKGQFGLSDYPGCPVCGAPGLAVCSGCGTVSCGASARETKQGLVITCPHCHRDGELLPGGPGTQVRAGGDTKKKKW